MAKRDFPTVLSFPLTVFYFGLFVRLVGFRWEVLALGPIAALATDFAIGYLMVNKWDQVSGTHHWARTLVAHCVGGGKYWAVTMRNPVSLPKQVTLDLLDHLGLSMEELKRSFNLNGRTVVDVPQDALPNLPGGEQLDDGAMVPPATSSGQQAVQVQIPKPPVTKEEEAVDLDVETVVGVSPRKRPRHRVMVCVKFESTPLSGTRFVGSARSKGRTRWHSLHTDVMDFGRKYAPGFGYYRLYVAVANQLGTLPSYFRDWLEKMALQGTLIQGQLHVLNMELQKLKAESDKARMWKGLYEEARLENDRMFRQVELIKRSLARTSLPLAIEWMDSLRPRMEEVKRKLSRLDMLRIAIVAGAGLAAWAAYALAFQTPELMVYGSFVPYAAAAIAFGAIILIGRKRLSA